MASLYFNINRQDLTKVGSIFKATNLATFPIRFKRISLTRAIVPYSIYNYDGQFRSVSKILTDLTIPAVYNEATYKIVFNDTYTTNDSKLASVLGLIVGKTYLNGESGDNVVSANNNVIYVCSSLTGNSSQIISSGNSSNILGVLEFDIQAGFINRFDYNNVINLRNDSSQINRYDIWFEDKWGRVINEINDFNIVLRLDSAVP